MNNPDARLQEDITETLGLDAATGRRRRWRWPLAAAIVLAAALTSTLFLGGSNGTTQYQTAAVQRGSLAVTVTATGTLQPTNQVEVGSELSGIVKSVAVDYNDQVTVGQVLARLDTAKLEAEVVQSEAALKAAEAKVLEAQASVDETRKQYARAQKLAPRQAMSEQDLIAAEAAYKRAEATLSSAKAQVAVSQASLDVNRTNLSKAAIRSPINGIVLTRNVEPGQTVAASLQAPVLFTLAEDLTHMELHVDVDEADVGQVSEGQAATFTVDAYPDRSFPARITQVRYGSQTVQGVVTYQTVLDVDNADLSLRPGMTATADITVRKLHDALLVPNAALRFTPPAPRQEVSSRGGSILSKLFPRRPRSTQRQRETAAAQGKQHRVWVLRDNRPVPITVTTGATNGIVTEVTGGQLQAGTAVVVDIVTSSG